MNTTTEIERLVAPAKEFLKAYFSDGKERRPSDFDDDIMGGLDTRFLYDRPPRWNESPFCPALGELVEEGVIMFKTTEDGQYVYWMPKTEGA
jgi:hypothetical protein